MIRVHRAKSKPTTPPPSLARTRLDQYRRLGNRLSAPIVRVHSSVTCFTLTRVAGLLPMVLE
jgi:hypothetical protein